MRHKLVVRLLAADGRLLGWAEVAAVARGDGQLHAAEPVLIAPDEKGIATVLSVHWADVNVEARQALNPPTVLDRMVTVFQAGPIFRVGEMPTELPPVTVRTPAVVGVPVGALGAVGLR